MQPSTSTERKRALICDDDTSMLALYSALVGRLGYDVEVKPNAEQCLASAETGDHFDLVIVDLNLPGMSGLELISRLRQSDSCKDAAILVISVRYGASDAERCLSEGASGFLPKPFKVKELSQAIKAVSEGEQLVARNRYNHSCMPNREIQREIVGGTDKGECNAITSH